MELAFPLYLFDITSGGMDEQFENESKLFDTKKGKRLRCRSCNHIITDDEQRISIAGGHSHEHTNPAGIDYQIGCFRNAPGCGTFGTATEEFTWFVGYRWQVAVCNACGEHLGWLFKGEDRFYGLIYSRLLTDTD